jgi:hypothetical protein
VEASSWFGAKIGMWVGGGGGGIGASAHRSTASAVGVLRCERKPCAHLPCRFSGDSIKAESHEVCSGNYGRGGG